MTDTSKTSEMWIGTDLGTSNSCVSVYQQSTQTLLIPTANGSVLLPSLIHFAQDGSVVVGEGARIAGLRSPERTIFSAKRMIGRKFSDPVIQEGIKTWPFRVIEGLDGFPLIEVAINGQIVHKTPVDIQTEILKHIRLNLAQQVLHWDTCENIVITVPAYFNHNQRHCTIQAAHQAGFVQVHIINEPSAAAFYFGYKESALADRLVNNILVFDLGGGTLDVSLIDVKDKIYRVVSTDGDTQFALSSLQSVTESSIALRGVPEGNVGFEDGFELTIDRTVLNKYFTGNKQGRASTLRAIQRCVKKADLTLKDIHKVILVGGSTRIPAISKMIGQFFGSPGIIAKTVNADEAVTLGACLHAATLSTSPLQQLKKPIELYDIAPLAYNITINNTSTIPFIPRNSCLVRDQDIIITHQVGAIPDQDGRIRFELVESDEVVEGATSIIPEQQQPQTPSGEPQSPQSPQPLQRPDHSDEVLHTVDTRFEPGINNSNNPTQQEFNITLRLTSDYTLLMSIKHITTGDGFEERIITPFQRYTQFYITPPPSEIKQQPQQPLQPPQQPPPQLDRQSTIHQTGPEPTTTQQQQQSTTITASVDGPIKDRPAAYWEKKNWIEIDDQNGLYYRNKITGDTTFYEDDFDLDAQ